jgi:hypothetical protein
VKKLLVVSLILMLSLWSSPALASDEPWSGDWLVPEEVTNVTTVNTDNVQSYTNYIQPW